MNGVLSRVWKSGVGMIDCLLSGQSQTRKRFYIEMNGLLLLVNALCTVFMVSVSFYHQDNSQLVFFTLVSTMLFALLGLNFRFHHPAFRLICSFTLTMQAVGLALLNANPISFAYLHFVTMIHPFMVFAYREKRFALFISLANLFAFIFCVSIGLSETIPTQNTPLVPIFAFFTAQFVIYGYRVFAHYRFMALRTENDQVKNALILRNSVIANFSHEFRTPLNAIIGYSDYLRTELAEYHDELEQIRSSGYNLLNLINNLIEVAKIEAGEFEIKESQFSIGQLIEKVASEISIIAAQKNNELVIEGKKKSEIIVGDAYQICHALKHVVSNALRFTQNGKVVISLSLESRKKDFLLLKVQDNGVGIEQNQLQKVDQQFMQARNGTLRSIGGVGIGLTITKTLMQAMGGEMLIESQLEVGTVVTLKIPVKKIKPAQKAEGKSMGIAL